MMLVVLFALSLGVLMTGVISKSKSNPEGAGYVKKTALYGNILIHFR